MILVTGATGTVGPHVLAGLLARTKSEIACLVRSKDDAAASTRIASSLSGAGYDGAALVSRVRPIAGDLSLPRLGVDARAYDALAEGLRSVVHVGAWLGTRERFSVEALANITGTTAIAELCIRAKARLDHVSSIGALGWTLEDDDGRLPEVLFTEHPEPSEDKQQYAYYFTKWMSEQVAIYASEGIAVTVHRVGDVYSLGGDAPVSAVTSAVAALRCVPDDDALSWSQHSISDRFAGESLAAIALDGVDDLRVVHDIAFVEGVTVADVRAAFAARNVALGTVPVDEWMKRLRSEVHWLSMLAPWQVDYLVVPKRPVPRFVNSAFRAAASACGLLLPTAEQRLAPFVAAATQGG